MSEKYEEKINIIEWRDRTIKENELKPLSHKVLLTVKNMRKINIIEWEQRTIKEKELNPLRRKVLLRVKNYKPNKQSNWIKFRFLFLWRAYTTYIWIWRSKFLI